MLRTLTWCPKDPVPILTNAARANDKTREARVAQHEPVTGSWQLSRSGPSIGPSGRTRSSVRELERNETEVTVPRTWREREDCYSRWGVLRGAAPETAYLFVLRTAELGIRPLVHESVRNLGSRLTGKTRSRTRVPSCQVLVTLLLQSDLIESTTKHHPTPCPRCRRTRLSCASISSLGS